MRQKKPILNIIYSYINKIKFEFKKLNRKLLNFIGKYPLLSFFILIALFIGLIVISNQFRKPPAAVEAGKLAIKVLTYRVGSAPKVSFQAKIEKSGVITVVAQVSGIVQSIYKFEGDQANQGDWLIGLASNYQGGNLLSVQRSLAQAQYQNTIDTYDLQKDLINKQKELADKTDANADEIRLITEKSLSETKDQLALNENILSILDNNLKEQEEATAASQNETAILGAKQAKSQYLTIVNQLRQAVRNTEYQINTEEPPAGLSDLGKDITKRQLEIQEKSLDLSKEISLLNLRIAQINEVTMFPAAPFAARIERIHVKIGQWVNPGQTLITLSGSDQTLTAVALVPQSIAQKISRLETSILHINNQQITIYPDHISKEPTDDRLFAVIYNINKLNETIGPDQKGFDPEPFKKLAELLVEGQSVQIDIPIGFMNTSAVLPYIPLDAIYQSQTSAYIYLLKDNRAEAVEIVLGDIYGRFVQVVKGLGADDEVILNRNVIAGDVVERQL